jgi:ABC-type dipeptide/oligopeptide/nickel transport system permease subunit
VSDVIRSSGGTTRSDRWAAARIRARRLAEVLTEVLKSPSTVVGVTIIVILVGMALFAPLVIPANMPDAYQMPRDWLQINAPPGTPGHVLGTTPQGGDVLYGVVWGARTSLRLAFIVVTVTMVVGVTVGSLAGFLGGRWDEILMRIVDVFLAVPELILALAIAAVLGPSFRNIILAITVLGWPKYARIIRGQILHLKDNEYVDAARVMGDSRWRIYRKDILPNAITPVIVVATTSLGTFIVAEATLSFLGIGLPPSIMSWGNDIGQARVSVATAPMVLFYPAAALSLTVLSFLMLGDVVRDALDPKARARR